MKYLFAAVLILTISLSYGQSINSKWHQDLSQQLEQFKSCDTTGTTGINPCNWYVGNALKTVYQINDFYSKELGRHMLMSEISAYLKTSKQWTYLGLGYEHKALAEAQHLANAKKAVVAIYINEEGLGHLSIITPGELKASGLWGFPVPNSASFFLSKPDESYINKGLSYAFSKNRINKVLLYARNY